MCAKQRAHVLPLLERWRRASSEAPPTPDALSERRQTLASSIARVGLSCEAAGARGREGGEREGQGEKGMAAGRPRGVGVWERANQR